MRNPQWTAGTDKRTDVGLGAVGGKGASKSQDGKLGLYLKTSEMSVNVSAGKWQRLPRVAGALPGGAGPRRYQVAHQLEATLCRQEALRT